LERAYIVSSSQYLRLFARGHAPAFFAHTFGWTGVGRHCSPIVEILGHWRARFQVRFLLTC
jgi:hypothetical protein